MITELTEKQKALKSVYKDKWIKIGLSTKTNKAGAEREIKDVYRIRGLEPPEKIIWADSPFAGLKIAREINPDSSTSTCGYGNLDASWLSFYDYFLEVVGLECCEKMRPLINLAQHCGWFWPFENHVVLTHKPVRITRDDDGRLHHDHDKALVYKDGWGLYRWHGMRVPDWIITDPGRITAKDINEQFNEELRRVMIERFGMPRWLTEIGAKKIAVDNRGTLLHTNYMAQWPGEDADGARYVLVQDASEDRQFALRVPPTTKTPTEGIAWTFGLKEDQYNPKKES